MLNCRRRDGTTGRHSDAQPIALACQHLQCRAGVAAEHFRPFARFVEHEHREDVGMRLAVAARQVRSADEERRRERVGGRGVAGDHARAEHAVGRAAGARIDHVAVALAVDLDELLAGAAGADRAVLDPQPADAPARQPRPQIDRPAASLAADRQHAAVSGREQRAPRAARRAAARAIRSSAKPLPIAPKFTSTPSRAKRTSALRRVEPHVLHADDRARVGDLLRRSARAPRASGSPSNG